MNEVIITGRLTRDPETRYTQTGKAVASFTVAVDNGFGENKSVDFIPVVAWEKLAEVVGNNLGKGRKVLVEGRLQIRDYEKDGVKRRQADVVAKNIEFLDSKNPASNRAADNSSPMDKFGSTVFPEEEIPF
jgi:single-strand DNA-binding protein